jgi:Ca-activated chloride channel family protein
LRGPRVNFRATLDIRILIAAITALFFLTALGAARAQPAGPSCETGLMRRDDAGTGTLLLKTATPGCYLAAPRVSADIAVKVSGPVARTKVTQRFENPADGWVEGVYLFPLPESAAVDTLKMKIGSHFIEGEIKERGEARQIYEQAKSEGKKASLVEQGRPNVFTNQVANIGPHETVLVQIEYQESLRFDQGKYRLRVPLVVAPRYSPAPSVNLVRYREGEEFSVFNPVPDRDKLDAPVLRPEMGKVNPVSLTVDIEAGFPLGIIESTSHEVVVARNGSASASVALKDAETATDKDFTLEFAPEPGSMPSVSLLREKSGDAEYMLALVMPPSSDVRAEARAREAIFVLDNSGSMAGESIKQAKASLLLALDRLTPADKFNVIRFDDTMTKLFRNSVVATQENVAYAKSFVDRIQAAGGTEMLPALLAALADPTPEDRTRLRQVIFLTDGGVSNEAQLFSVIDEKLGRSRLFTVGIGSAPNAYFMSGAARAGRGTYTYVGSSDQVAPKMRELFAKLERPVMTDLAARWPNTLAGEAWPDPLPDLYAGEPIVITLRAPKIEGQLRLTGNLEGKPWETRFDLSRAHDAAGIEKLWARNKIAALDESRVEGVDAGQIDHAVLDVALTHHLTSRLTSLVAVDVTPSRPADARLSTRKVPLNLPEGWVYDKVFGESPPVREQHASAVIPAAVLTQLAVSDAPPAAVEPQDAGLVLPQGGTDSRLMMFAGLFLILIAGLLMLHEHKHGSAQ